MFFDIVLWIIGIVCFVLGAISFTRREKWGGLIAGIGVLATVAVFTSAFVIIPTGYVGVPITFGQVEATPMNPGFHWKVPFVQRIEEVNCKQQDQEYTGKVWSETAEQTVIYMEDVTVTYQIDPGSASWICANVTNYEDNLVSASLVESALKSAVRGVETVNSTNRGVVEPLAKDAVQAALDEKYGDGVVRVVKVVISNMDFEDAYNEAIEQRQIAVLNREQQAITNETNIAKAKADADAARERAQGEADAALIEAKAKAEANRIVSESITESTQRQDAIKKWNGELPRYVGGAGAGAFGIIGSTE